MKYLLLVVLLTSCGIEDMAPAPNTSYDNAVTRVLSGETSIAEELGEE